MHDVVRKVFSRLHSLDPATEEAKIAAAAEDEADVKMSVAVAAESSEGAVDPEPVIAESEVSPSKPPAAEIPQQRSDCQLFPPLCRTILKLYVMQMVYHQ